MKDIIELFKNHHDDNIEGICRIIKSIDEYFIYMQRNHRWRDDPNKSVAMKEWRETFITCKENLSTSYQEVIINLTSASYKQTISDKLYREFIEDIKSLPEIIQNSSTVYNPRWNTSVSSTNSNIALVEVWKIRYKTQAEDIPKMFDGVLNSFKNYNYWLAQLEKNQTGNYIEMTRYERILKDLFQDNQEARGLREHILKYKFNNLALTYMEAPNKLITNGK